MDQSLLNFAMYNTRASVSTIVECVEIPKGSLLLTAWKPGKGSLPRSRDRVLRPWELGGAICLLYPWREGQSSEQCGASGDPIHF